MLKGNPDFRLARWENPPMRMINPDRGVGHTIALWLDLYILVSVERQFIQDNDSDRIPAPGCGMKKMDVERRNQILQCSQCASRLRQLSWLVHPPFHRRKHISD